MTMGNVYIALLHHPVQNRYGDVITTAVTNLDIHDIARAARTYGVKGFYIVTPLAPQQEFAATIMNHWTQGYGARHNPWRKAAFDITHVAESLEQPVEDIARREQSDTVTIVATGASLINNCIWGIHLTKLPTRCSMLGYDRISQNPR
jgi:hypothetical protein